MRLYKYVNQLHGSRLVNVTAARLVVLYGIRKFIIVFTRTRLWSLSLTRCFHPYSPFQFPEDQIFKVVFSADVFNKNVSRE